METKIRLDIFFSAKDKVRYKIMENWKANLGEYT